MIINFIVLYKNINIKLEKTKFILKPILCTATMCVISRFVFENLSVFLQGKIVTVISIMCAIIIYILSIILTNTLKIKEFNLKNRLKF